MKHLARSFRALLLVAFGTAMAADYDEKRKELEGLRTEIRRIEQELRTHKSHQHTATKELRKLEQQVAAAAKALASVEREYDRKEGRVVELRSAHESAREQAETHKAFLARQVRAAYLEGRQEYLKLLLNQQDPAAIDRVLAYYGYLNTARSARITEALAEVGRVAALERSLNEELGRLAALRDQRQREREKLLSARAAREQELARLERAIAVKTSERDRILEDVRTLEELIGRLKATLADVGDVSVEKIPFDSRRGKLIWPVDGPVTARFGAARGVSDLRWAGMLIESPAGTGVRAIAHGHVVFAEWLRGFGLLIILDHGDGFMSLYGHNEALYKETGDWVRSGEIIAGVGASGGRAESALYFEIRAGGKPIDPQEWLRPTSVVRR